MRVSRIICAGMGGPRFVAACFAIISKDKRHTLTQLNTPNSPNQLNQLNTPNQLNQLNTPNSLPRWRISALLYNCNHLRRNVLYKTEQEIS